MVMRVRGHVAGGVVGRGGFQDSGSVLARRHVTEDGEPAPRPPMNFSWKSIVHGATWSFTHSSSCGSTDKKVSGKDVDRVWLEVRCMIRCGAAHMLVSHKKFSQRQDHHEGAVGRHFLLGRDALGCWTSAPPTESCTTCFAQFGAQWKVLLITESEISHRIKIASWKSTSQECDRFKP